MNRCGPAGPSAGSLGSFRPHTQACAEVSESWLWSSGLRRLFILQPSEALKPRSDVSRLSAPVCPRSQFHNTNSSPQSISDQLYIYFFPTNLFSQLVSLNFPSDPSALPSVRHSVFPPLAALHPTHPRADFGFFFFIPSALNFPPLPSWRSAVQWLESQNVRSSYINI